MMLPNAKHIRKYPRMNAEFVVAYHRRSPDGGEGPVRVTRTRTLGLGGVMFVTEDPLAPGEPLALELILGERVICAAARVVYADPLPEGTRQVGVEFVAVSEDDREHLLSYYLEHEYRIAPG